MIKNFKLMLRFYKGTGFSAFILFVMIFVSQYSFVLTYGAYSYNNRYNEAYKQISNIEDSVYYDVLFSEYRDNEKFEQMIRDIESNPKVKAVSSVNELSIMEVDGARIKVYAISPEFYENDKRLKKSKAGYDKTGVTIDGLIEVFSVSSPLSSYKVGSKIKATIGGASLDVRLAGKYKDKTVLPMFIMGSTNISIYEIFSECSNIAFVMKTPEVKSILNYSSLSERKAGFIIFNPGTSSKEQEDILSVYKDKGLHIIGHDDVIINSKKESEHNYKQAMTFPFLALSISFVFLIAVVVLITDQKMYTFSIYYLCGLGKLKSYFLLIGSIGIVEVLSVIVNSGIITYYINSTLQRPILLEYVGFNRGSYIALFVHVLLMLTIQLLEVILIYHNKSFIEIKNVEAK